MNQYCSMRALCRACALLFPLLFPSLFPAIACGDASGDGSHHSDRAHTDSEATHIGEQTATRNAIETTTAGAAVLQQELLVYGRLVAVPDRIASARARFPGIVRSVDATFGQTVQAGDVLATIESNESLRAHPVLAPVGGVITGRSVNLGDLNEGQALFTVADLRSLWAELDVFPGQRSSVSAGQQVVVAVEGREYRGRILHLLPDPAGSPRSIARVVVANADAALMPGQMVQARIVIATSEVPLAVPVSATHRDGAHTVVYRREGEYFNAVQIVPGRSDGNYIEVLSGLAPGDNVATTNSYLVKADIEKSAAGHAH